MPKVSACPKCGATTIGDFANCLRCQAPLPAPTAAPQPAAPRPPVAPPPQVGPPCPHCGATLQPGDGFCTACGKSPTQAAAAPAPPPPPVYQQPASAPAAYAPAQPAYGYPQQFANNSGTGGAAPPEVRGWNWGAFFWSWLWGIANGVWISLLICMLGPIGSIWLGVKGSEMAWAKRRFDSVEQFKGTQRAWATWGWVLFALNLVGCVIIALVFGAAIVAGIASGEFDPNDFNF